MHQHLLFVRASCNAGAASCEQRSWIDETTNLLQPLLLLVSKTWHEGKEQALEQEGFCQHPKIESSEVATRPIDHYTASTQYRLHRPTEPSHGQATAI